MTFVLNDQKAPLSNEAQYVAQSWEDEPLQMSFRIAFPGASCVLLSVSTLGQAVTVLIPDP